MIKTIHYDIILNYSTYQKLSPKITSLLYLNFDRWVMDQSLNQNSFGSGLKLLSKNKAASYLGIGKKKLDQLTSQGRIRFLLINNKTVFPVQSLQEFIDSNLISSNSIVAENTKSLTRFDQQSNPQSQKELINYNSIISRIILEKKNGLYNSSK